MELIAAEFGRTARYALASNARTARLIALMIVAMIAYTIWF